MTWYRTTVHLPLRFDALTPEHAEALIKAAEDALAKTVGEHACRDGAAHHQPPIPIDAQPTCIHCARPARQPVLISRPGETPAYACLPVCPPRHGDEETAA